MKDKKFIKYGKSAKGNYEIIDSIGVPHPYCISGKLVAFASDYYNGILDAYAIEAAERHEIYCDICKKIHGENYSKPILTYKEHEQALLVACYIDFKESKKAEKELRQYLLSIKDKATKDKYVGFAFIDRSKKEGDSK